MEPPSGPIYVYLIIEHIEHLGWEAWNDVLRDLNGPKKASAGPTHIYIYIYGRVRKPWLGGLGGHVRHGWLDSKW